MVMIVLEVETAVPQESNFLVPNWLYHSVSLVVYLVVVIYSQRELSFHLPLPPRLAHPPPLCSNWKINSSKIVHSMICKHCDNDDDGDENGDDEMPYHS
eukprot:1512822-Ditylum_brightwellii.AAC.1